MVKLGTQAGDVAKMDLDRSTNNHELRRKWIEERDKLESRGKGNALMKIQDNSMPDIDESIKDFKLNKLFSFGNGMLEWCQGVVLKVVNPKINTVKVRWNKDCL